MKQLFQDATAEELCDLGRRIQEAHEHYQRLADNDSSALIRAVSQLIAFGVFFVAAGLFSVTAIRAIRAIAAFFGFDFIL